MGTPFYIRHASFLVAFHLGANLERMVSMVPSALLAKKIKQSKKPKSLYVVEEIPYQSSFIDEKEDGAGELDPELTELLRD